MLERTVMYVKYMVMFGDTTSYDKGNLIVFHEDYHVNIKNINQTTRG